MNIAIIGAGVAGLTCATEFVARGAKVTIYEKGPSIGEQACSWWAGGMLAPWCEGETAESSVVKLGQHAKSWWKTHTAQVQENGTLVFALDRDLSELRTFAKRTTDYQSVGAQEIAQLEPDLGERFSQGLFFPEEAHIDPRKSILSLFDQLVSAGVIFKFNCEVEPGTLSGFECVVDCTGLAAQDAIPELRGVKGEMLLLRSRDVTLQRSIRLLHPRIPLYVVPRGNGLFMVGATMIENTERTRVSARSVFEMLGSAFALHPAFSEAEIVEIGVDARPAYLNNLPKVNWRGKVLTVNGMYRHGFLLAPVMARVAANAIFEGYQIPELMDEYCY
ncbi:FAD-dependent oxidoreductase [Pseudoalteromonas sp. SMS1]|uniref:FAD-dependent oxidoreductase n=1 Tax=Pseudoalteromonas sp. SMS1 TaxID=2908894 RepID=UPI001F19BC62|nr:FAD-dependent oxidoreductase [Pseudoalteromonas sp. SMS1]MCF2858492.1 FAD-dependent oxidoreductase [Pseudoalteromonas sp. SMS1]